MTRQTLSAENLSYAVVSEDTRSYDFYNERRDFESEGKGWRIHEGMDTGRMECPKCEGAAEECEACDGEGGIETESAGEWQPAMNLLYPLPGNFEVPGDWREALCNMTIVQVDGEPYLALTGGGMDMTWYIVETYMRLGLYPPFGHTDLPAGHDEGLSADGMEIVKACQKSVECMAARASRRLDHLAGFKGK